MEAQPLNFDLYNWFFWMQHKKLPVEKYIQIFSISFLSQVIWHIQWFDVLIINKCFFCQKIFFHLIVILIHWITWNDDWIAAIEYKPIIVSYWFGVIRMLHVEIFYLGSDVRDSSRRLLNKIVRPSAFSLPCAIQLGVPPLSKMVVCLQIRLPRALCPGST